MFTICQLCYHIHVLSSIIRNALLRVVSERQKKQVIEGKGMKEKKERSKSNEKTGRRQGVDFYRRHGTSRPNDGPAVHRMIGSFPIVAHNQQYIHEHSRFQICRHDQHREPFICLYVYRMIRACALATHCEHTRENAELYMQLCTSEGALQ